MGFESLSGNQNIFITIPMNKVVCSALIKNDEGKYLAIRLDKEVDGGVIIPAGGKLEPNETARECVVREVKEEVGLDVEVVKLAGIVEEEYEDGIWTFIVYECKIISGEPVNMEPNQIMEIVWVDLGSIKNGDKIMWVS